MKKTLLTFGTRPELIKIAPIVLEYNKRLKRGELILVHTGQHDSLVKQDLIDFNIQPDYSFTLNRKSANLNELAGKLLISIGELFSTLRRNGVRIEAALAQGDTASTFATALCAFHEGVPFYHIEAGLRSGDLNDPFPEEYYRRTISQTADFNFVPTALAYSNLIEENIDSTKILVVGNTVIDHLKKHHRKSNLSPKRQIIVTLHRRNNKAGCRAAYIDYFYNLALKNKNWMIRWVKHPNTKTGLEKLETLGNVQFESALPYQKFIKLYQETSLIFTDSGGVQEEACYLKIPCVVMRGTTERVDGIVKGVAKYWNPNELNLDDQLNQFKCSDLSLNNELYGTGRSAEIILDQLDVLKDIANSR